MAMEAMTPERTPLHDAPRRLYACRTREGLSPFLTISPTKLPEQRLDLGQSGVFERWLDVLAREPPTMSP